MALHGSPQLRAWTAPVEQYATRAWYAGRVSLEEIVSDETDAVAGDLPRISSSGVRPVGTAETTEMRAKRARKEKCMMIKMNEWMGREDNKRENY